MKQPLGVRPPDPLQVTPAQLARAGYLRAVWVGLVVPVLVVHTDAFGSGGNLELLGTLAQQHPTSESSDARASHVIDRGRLAWREQVAVVEPPSKGNGDAGREKCLAVRVRERHRGHEGERPAWCDDGFHGGVDAMRLAVVDARFCIHPIDAGWRRAVVDDVEIDPKAGQFGVPTWSDIGDDRLRGPISRLQPRAIQQTESAFRRLGASVGRFSGELGGADFGLDRFQRSERNSPSDASRDQQRPVRPIWWPEPFVPIVRLLIGSWCLWWGPNRIMRGGNRNDRLGTAALFIGLGALFLGPW